MMSWFLIAVAAYAVMAFSQVLDKVFLDRFFRDSSTYAAFVGFAGLVVVLGLPWTQPLPSFAFWALLLFAGALFVLALLPFLSALKEDEATRIIPVVGATVPLATLLLERVFLGVQMPGTAYLGAAFLVVGGVLLTASRTHGRQRSRRAVAKSVLAGVLFATSFTLSKYAYTYQDFWTAFVWMRVGGGLVGIGILVFSAAAQREAGRLLRLGQKQVLAGYTANQGLAALGFGMQSYAISLASAGLVTAMQGVQYLFVIAFVVLFAKVKPGLLGERITKQVVLEKLTATACLITGLALLAI